MCILALLDLVLTTTLKRGAFSIALHCIALLHCGVMAHVEHL